MLNTIIVLYVCLKNHTEIGTSYRTCIQYTCNQKTCNLDLGFFLSIVFLPSVFNKIMIFVTLVASLVSLRCSLFGPSFRGSWLLPCYFMSQSSIDLYVFSVFCHFYCCWWFGLQLQLFPSICSSFWPVFFLICLQAGFNPTCFQHLADIFPY